MERFLVPRGYEFMVKTLRLFAEHGALDRANALRGAALSADRPDIWAMSQDLIRYFSGITWPDNMRRVCYSHLLDRMVQGGDVEQAENLHKEALEWAVGRQDQVLAAWIRFAGSRLDFRRQDLYRGRDRAKDALTAFKALGDKMKTAEVHNHLALIEFTDGNINASMDQLRMALEEANVPPVQANVEFIRGLISQRTNKPSEAAEHFRKANELAGNIGMAPLALEAGFKYGEALFVLRDFSRAADVLLRVAQIAASLQNHPRERAAVALLTQVHGQLRNYEAALQAASRTLQLTQELRFEQALAVDIYHVAYYNLLLGRPTEAVSLFKKARERLGADDPRFLRELSFHLGTASKQINERSTAISALKEALSYSRQSREWKRVIQCCEQLAELEAQGGNKAMAQKLLEEALTAADTGKLNEERKGILRRIKDLS
jgi:tetratricopeptide (TPR) repeat protein